MLPEYEVYAWSERTFAVDAHPYTRAAYASKKWAFITDYIRLWALYHYGGIYMDADVEVIKPFDPFLEHRAFTGHETDDLLVTATMGAERHHPWVKMLLDYYDTAEFDGVTPNTQVITRMSQPLIESHDDGYRTLRDDVVIYPIDYFCPFDHVQLRPTPTERTHAVHHFAGSWTGRAQR